MSQLISLLLPRVPSLTTLLPLQLPASTPLWLQSPQKAQTAADQARAANAAAVGGAAQSPVPQTANPVDPGNTGAIQEPSAPQQQDIEFEDNADLIDDGEEEVGEAATP